MEESVLVLYDREEEYVRLLSDFLRGHENMPWVVHAYTSKEELLLAESGMEIAMLVIAESVYGEEMEILTADRRVILNESGVIRWESVPNINKYQQAEAVLRELLELYLDVAGPALPRLQHAYETSFIGIYSPVRRCMQTSVAITMCQMLAEEHRTLYMNFEHYAGITELLPDMQSRDLADLLYFLTAKEESFRLRLQAMIQRKGNLEYIPPMKSGQNLLTITAGEWLELMQKIEELGEYRYVVMDLSESMQGLFEILRSCKRVFTLTKDDYISRSKLLQYEQLLQLYDYEDILHKTSRHSVPKIYHFPAEPNQYTRGELGDFVRTMIKEL